MFNIVKNKEAQIPRLTDDEIRNLKLRAAHFEVENDSLRENRSDQAKKITYLENMINHYKSNLEAASHIQYELENQVEELNKQIMQVTSEAFNENSENTGQIENEIISEDQTNVDYQELDETIEAAERMKSGAVLPNVRFGPDIILKIPKI